ncbi:hypothetical protein PVNG_05557 [Plasmodium vivax North Korean]|uniref:VIR protein n=1 Tax=Plasmodium vivax North Korean TaxID=1035514 RepID=A0A0J9TZW7_PLAVI|nr:hypothetical protein PVNG_05557 [Plasmodium vivax North Korean]
MAPSTEQDPGYLFYEKYTNLSKEFKRKVKPKDTPDHWEDCLKHVIALSKNNLPYSQNIFQELINHFSQSMIFISYEAPDCCRYINFWLNNEIRKSHSDVSSLKFSIFKDFAEKYSELKYANQKQSCKPYLNHLAPRIYIKMKLLYYFYDMYDIIKSTPTNQESTACDTLSHLHRLYNGGIENYFQHDRNFFEKLNNLKNLIKELKVESINGCRWILSKFKEPDVELEIQKQQLSKKAEMVTQETLSQEKSVRALDTAQTQLQQEVTEPPPIPEETIIAETREENHNHRETTNNDETYYHITQTDAITEIPPRIEPHRVGIVSLRTPLHPEQKEYFQPHELSNESARESSTILGSITGVLKDVEPGPVLGVSGGMGVLFILFKVFKALKI